jgi:hypothetical protein
MILDNQTMFSDNQAIIATARSTNVIDLQQTGIPYGNIERLSRDVGKSDDVPLLIQVTETFNNLTSLQIDIQTSDDPAFGSGVVTHATTGAVLLAALVADWRPNYTTLPEGGVAGMKRYLSLNYSVVGAAPTAGKIKSGVVAGVQTNGR